MMSPLVPLLVPLLENYLTAKSWKFAASLELPTRIGTFVSADELHLHERNLRYLATHFPNGLYVHQHAALQFIQQGKNVCMLSGTASGKSLVFYVAAIEAIVRDPKTRILALYPLKALGLEQQSRWQQALEAAGLRPDVVGRIDGNVPVAGRMQILRTARVLIATPDVIHAWLLSSLTDGTVISFLRGLRLFITDEIHSYSGVFGSNSAYLFRRLRYCLATIGTAPQFIAASATVASPESYLRNLFGLEFHLVPAETDSSPRQKLAIRLVTPPHYEDLLSETAALLEYLAKSTDSRFIAFVDSRKLSEHLAAIASRDEGTVDETEGEDAAPQTPKLLDHLDRFSILPFRAGLEEGDRQKIQRRLSDGTLRGIVSTSALELGIDIPHLDCGVLVGVPRSATSLTQRIGRVGRRVPGCVLIMNTGSLHDEAVFRKPSEALNRPYSEVALYLENPRIQYIHALCLARHGGEHDQICEAAGLPVQQDLLPHAVWPTGFPELMRKERLGEIGPELQSMKSEAGDNPNYAFPLRDVESQYQVEHRSGPEFLRLGSLSFSQVMREAYPGAVYYYTTIPYRVSRVETLSKTINVFRSKRYFTSPNRLPTLIFPNLSPGNVFTANEFASSLNTVECNIQVREAIAGFDERRGQTKITCQYPISPVDSAKTGIVFRHSRFTRNFFTTGLILSHPMMVDTAAADRAAELVYESFLTLIPFERQDINFAVDRHRADRPPYARQGARFIAIYDQTYGSLRLTSRLADPETLRIVLDSALQVAALPDMLSEPRVIELLEALAQSSKHQAVPLTTIGPTLPLSNRYAKVILPGSSGIVTTKANEEARILRVFVHPNFGLCYRVEYDGMIPVSDLDIILPVANVAEIPGDSQLGWYDFETGELLDAIPGPPCN